MRADTKVVTGSFRARSDAQHAVERLVAAGFRRETLSVLVSRDPAPVADELDRLARVERPEPNRAAESACAGGTIGGALGALVAGLAGVGSIAVPDVGVVLAGSIVAALAGLGAGGAAGGLAGALIGFGIGEGERRSTRRMREARVVVAVETVRDRARGVIEILRSEGSREIAVG